MEEAQFKCRYCEKTYRKESTLAAHLCEQKRRWQQEKDIHVQWGLQAYLKFYESTQGSAKFKSYADFVKSPYYGAFVKFGLEMVNARCLNFLRFTEWLLKNNKKLDHWCKPSYYEEWRFEYLRKEACQDALDRGIQEMVKYAEENADLKNGFRDYFRYGNSNRICFHITTGRISPWLLLNCKTGVEFLETLTEKQLEIILPYIDPEFWQRKFKDYVADRELAKDILLQAGL